MGGEEVGAKCKIALGGMCENCLIPRPMVSLDSIPEGRKRRERIHGKN
jgi:hypothetical protein